MFTPGPSLEEMEHAGFSPEDYEEDDIEVWPENWPAFELLAQLRTQWRVGSMSIVGLDYNVLYTKFKRMKLSRKQCDELEDDIRIMEDAALTVLNARK